MAQFDPDILNSCAEKKNIDNYLIKRSKSRFAKSLTILLLGLFTFKCTVEKNGF